MVKPLRKNLITNFLRIDNIEFGYQSPTPNSENPSYHPVCECGVGYTGELCELCARGFARSTDTGLCDVPCQCNGHSELCDEGGICLVSSVLVKEKDQIRKYLPRHGTCKKGRFHIGSIIALQHKELGSSLKISVTLCLDCKVPGVV